VEHPLIEWPEFYLILFPSYFTIIPLFQLSSHIFFFLFWLASFGFYNVSMYLFTCCTALNRTQKKRW